MEMLELVTTTLINITDLFLQPLLVKSEDIEAVQSADRLAARKESAAWLTS